MSKQKPNKGLMKRIRLTAHGKVKRARAFGRHLRSHKPGSQLRGYRRPTYACSADLKRMSHMLCKRITSSGSRAAAKAETNKT